MNSSKIIGSVFGAVALLASATAQAASPAPFRIVWDNFQEGFTVGAPGSSARWFFQTAGPLTFDDGIPTTDAFGLHVIPLGTNPVTQQPAFTLTVGQEGSPDNPLGLPGDLDHPKWLVYANHTSSIGTPGFDLVPGQELECEATLAGRTFGTAGNPFGVINPNGDQRLASYSLTAIDVQTFIVAEFFVTNNIIYAQYERLAAGRATLGDYAAFTFAQPVAITLPELPHRFALAFDRSAGTIRWVLDGVEVFRVSSIGDLLPRPLMTVDHGGTPTVVTMQSVDCGLGMFTLLDGARPGDVGLVELSNAPGYYFDPNVGPPTPGRFIDTQSLHQDRLFGQGARIDVQQVVFASRLSNGPGFDD